MLIEAISKKLSVLFVWKQCVSSKYRRFSEIMHFYATTDTIKSFNNNGVELAKNAICAITITLYSSF